MARNKSSMVYPEEREGKTKDANKKLKSQIRSLKKTIKQMDTQIKTLSRSFDKSCDFIQNELKDKKLPDILKMIDDFDFKETEKGRERFENEKQAGDSCPRCDSAFNFKVTHFKEKGFTLESCSCGYRKRVDGEGA